MFEGSGKELPSQSQIPQQNDLGGSEEEESKNHLALYKATLRADGAKVKEIIEKDSNAIRARLLSSTLETALHIAVRTRKGKDFLKLLVGLVDNNECLCLKDGRGNTALHVAALIGYRFAANLLVGKCEQLLQIRNNSEDLPVDLAARFAHKKTLVYLLNASKYNLIRPDGGLFLLNNLIECDMFGIALDLVEDHKSILDASTRNDWKNCTLKIIALKVDAFRSTQRYNFWQRFIYTYVTVGGTSAKTQRRSISNVQDIEGQTSCNELNKAYQMVQNWYSTLTKVPLDLVPCIKDIRAQKQTHEQAISLVKHLCTTLERLDPTQASEIYTDVLLTAASLGVHEIIDKIIDTFPDAIYPRENSTVESLCRIAIENRSDQVFYQIYETTDLKHQYLDLKDDFENNLLHVAAKLAPRHKLNLVSGAALQMQREKQWYKEMENLLHPNSRRQKNKDGKTPEMIFTEEHESLKVEGEKWMKDTANSCTFAAALIATVVFAAAFTVPGGDKENSGIPIFYNNMGFIIFAISDAISLFTSTTSLLMFLSILTSRYAEEDFIQTLPKRLIVGLVTLFVSITFMMLAFTATLYLVVAQKRAWILIPVAALACLPVTSFLHLQFPLLIDVISSTYGRRVFGKKGGRPFY